MRVGLTGAAIGAVAWAGFAGFRAWQGEGSPSLGSLLASPASLEAAPVRAVPASVPTESPVASTANPPAPVAGDSTGAMPDSGLATTMAPLATSGAQVQSAAPGQGAPPVAPPVATPLSIPAASPVAPPAAPAATPSAPVVPPLQPIVAEGRTELQNGIYALRQGDTVTVHFDTPEARTRRPEKFEQIVRATLPTVHGAAAASILAGIATGNLVGPGETITEPQGNGISLRGADGKSLSVLPQTRPGRDGPLVVAYRVVPAR